MFDHISLQTVLITYVAVLFSLSVHEASHATVAYLLDDDTAKKMGRMTLNPIAHMDLLGTVILPLLGMLTGFRVLGWAKPVPVNGANLTRKLRQRVGMAFVAAAGPTSNLVLSMVFIPVLAWTVRSMTPPGLDLFGVFRASLQFSSETFHESGYFNPTQVFVLLFLGRLVAINIGLAIFNLLPVGPLDGASIIRGFLPYRWLATFDRIQPTISIVLLIGFFLGFIGIILGPLWWLAETFYLNPYARFVLGV